MLEKLQYLFTHHAVLSQELMWTCFGIAVIVLLFLDLCVFNRKNEVPSFAHTLWVCVAYIGAGLLFGVFVWYEEGTNKAMEYFTGFLVEKSLSMDNIFVMSIIFTSIGVPRIYQHRVLFWGILGAIVMRALLIGVGEALIKNFHWVLYIFSAFLIYTGVKMAMHSLKKDEHVDNEENIKNSAIYRFVEKYFPVTHEIDGPHFITKKADGKHYITPLLFALITIELMDVVFALDSIPAIFLLTDDVFIVYTSNIFAILGLRALYFWLEAAARAVAAGGNMASAGGMAGTVNQEVSADAVPKAGTVKPARSEDITAVIQNWRGICYGLAMSLKPILEHYTTKANGGGNKLQLIYDNDTYYSMVSTPENIQTIKKVIADKTGLDMEIEVIRLENGADASQDYDTLEDLCRMNIEEEDF